ncbi:MAG: endoribonuclease MazF [Cyanobacteria bacterium J06635_15]
MAYCPDRGDIAWLDFNPQAGREQAKRRPAIVLSPKAYNRKVGLAIVCPITSKIKGYPFEIRLPDGLPVSGVILSDQIKSMDWRVRRMEFIAHTPASVMTEIVAKINTLLP